MIGVPEFALATAAVVADTSSGVLDRAAPAHLVGTGGAVGAVLRYAIGGFLDEESFPYSVLAVNVVGTFLAALVVALDPGEEWLLLLAVGVCGSLTTFSSFSFQAVHLWEQGRRTAAIVHAAGNLVACLVAAGAAFMVASVA